MLDNTIDDDMEQALGTRLRAQETWYTGLKPIAWQAAESAIPIDGLPGFNLEALPPHPVLFSITPQGLDE